MMTLDQRKAVYYLRSIHRQLKDAVSTIGGEWPSIGSEVAYDNLDWLDNYIKELEKS